MFFLRELMYESKTNLDMFLINSKKKTVQVNKNPIKYLIMLKLNFK